jgi:hypothetical protein
MIACLDLEGVLVPEIWINVAERTGIATLCRTTRDEPDYDKLMRGRLAILDEHRLGLPDIQAVIGTMEPLDGALQGLSFTNRAQPLDRVACDHLRRRAFAFPPLYPEWEEGRAIAKRRFSRPVQCATRKRALSPSRTGGERTSRRRSVDSRPSSATASSARVRACVSVCGVK